MTRAYLPTRAFGSSLISECNKGIQHGHVMTRNILGNNFNNNEFISQQKRAFGAGDLKIVAARMKSVKSIQKITKAMKMVAASKLKADQRRLERGIPFSLPAQELFSRLPLDKETAGPLTILCLASDKGLCGGVNSAVAKATRLQVAQSAASSSDVKIFAVGDKIRAALQRHYAEKFSVLFTEATRSPWNFQTASLIAERIMAANPHRLTVIYNHFKSVISYETRTRNVLTSQLAKQMSLKELSQFEFEPEMTYIWNDLLEFYQACTIYGCMLDGIASEQSARMAAMDNASNNAGEMLGSLTLRYNKARQAKITMELIEIISGANAL